MKLSISIPDDLWLTVRRDGEANSQTIQEALRLLADKRQVGSDPLPGAGGTTYGDEPDVISQTLDRLATEAIALRQTGYTVGFELAQRLAWSDLEQLPSDMARIRAALEGACLNAHEGFIEDVLDSALLATVHSWGDQLPQLYDDDRGRFIGSPTLFKGMAQAVAEVREAVRRRVESSVAPSEGT